MSVSARRVLILLAAVMGVGLTVSLGLWQMRRADYKLELAAQIARRQHEAPWTNVAWPCQSAIKPLHSLPEQRPVILQGHWLADKVVYLDNRVMADRTGFYVATPLQLDPAPSCGPAIVLVQRGWAPRHQMERQRLPQVVTPTDMVQVHGRLVGDLSQAYQLGQEAMLNQQVPSPLLRQNVSRADWLAWTGALPAVGAVLQMEGPGAAVPGELLRAWPAPDTGVGKHQAYAAQWFALALIITGLYVWFQLLRPSRAS